LTGPQGEGNTARWFPLSADRQAKGDENRQEVAEINEIKL